MFKKIKVVFFLLIILHLSVYADNNGKYEVRAAWLTTAYRLDWPQTLIKTPSDISRQQDELVNILDELKAAHFNTILFQVRHKGSVIYPSNIEPYSKVLSIAKDYNPGYDALKFAIDECHKRGMECHAWLVTLPADDLSKSVVKKYPDPDRIILTYKRNQYLDPSSKATSKYLSKLVEEIILNYNVDGIHLDYLRYPENIINFPDEKVYKNSKTAISLDDWRRDNITRILKSINYVVKTNKPWVKLSVSPIGKHSDTNRYSSKGWNAFEEVYQDVFKWMKEDLIDQIYPMIYFQGDNFYPFVLDWNQNKGNTQVIPGIGVYFLVEPNRTWSISEIKRQVNFIKDNQLDGAAFFRTEFLLKNTKGILDILKQQYQYPSLNPKIKTAPIIDILPPDSLRVTISRYKAILNWTHSSNHYKYNLYKSSKYPVDINNTANMIEHNLITKQYTYTAIIPSDHISYYAVTAIDEYGNESSATQLRPRQDIEFLE